jgi:IclR family acetate operon transcriptional repressor
LVKTDCSIFKIHVPYLEHPLTMSSANDILEIVSFLIRSKGAQKLTDVGKAVYISKSTVYRIMSSLKTAGWVVQDPLTRKYAIGTRLLELAFSLTSQIDLKEISLPFLQALNSETKESVMLSARVGLERMYLEQVRNDYGLQPIVEIGRRMPLWIGASGKAILAHLEEGEIETVLGGAKQSGLAHFASGKPVDFLKLRQELTKIRSQGFALSRNERMAGLTSVAAPIFSNAHRVVGAISVGGATGRFSLELARRYAPMVKKTAERISLQLAAKPDVRAPDSENSKHRPPAKSRGGRGGRALPTPSKGRYGRR